MTKALFVLYWEERVSGYNLQMTEWMILWLICCRSISDSGGIEVRQCSTLQALCSSFLYCIYLLIWDQFGIHESTLFHNKISTSFSKFYFCGVRFSCRWFVGMLPPSIVRSINCPFRLDLFLDLGCRKVFLSFEVFTSPPFSYQTFY